MFGMDTQRLILLMIFSFSALFLWQAWERERAPVPPPQASATPARPADVPPTGASATPAVPGAGVPSATPAPAAGIAAVPGATAPAASAPAGQTVTIRTD